MKKRTVLTMILAVTIISGILSGCGEKKASAKEPSTKAEQLSITDNDNKKKQIITDSVTINVLVDKGWDADSTPAILHIAAKDTEDVEFYHAITPDAEGGKGSTTVTLAQGTYEVEFISPLNHDGSAYEIYDMGASQEITVEFGSNMTVDCEMTQIPAEQVTDEMIQDIVTKTQAAVEKGDETLKGDAGKATLDKLASNVQNSPNASEETKDMANTVKENTDTETKPEETVKTEAPTEKTDVPESKQTENNTATNNNNTQNNVAVNSLNVAEETKDMAETVTGTTNTETKPEETVTTETPTEKTETNTNNNVQNNVQNNNTQNNTAVNNNQNTQNNTTVNNQNTQPTTTVQPTQPAQPSAPVVTEPEEPVHTHTWADHVVTTQEWVTNIVTVPDYEEQTTYVWVCNCGAIVPIDEADSHGFNHAINEEAANGHEEAQTTTVQVGSHTEDQGHYETKTSVDYRYCTGCGARQ